MKKNLTKILLVFILFVTSASYVSAMPVTKEYTDNIQRSIVKSGTTTNLAHNSYNKVNPKSSINLDYRVGIKTYSATFSSSNTKVATVNKTNGVVTFKNDGKVTIYVTGSDKRKYQVKFEVNGVIVHVNISKQTATLYKNGKRLRVAKVVTGKAGVTPTPKGTFKLAYKQRNTYLDGSTVGYDYYLAVKYWMPLANTGGVGFHDASWRGYNQFGGKYYLSDGSHGCINMRTGDVAYFYKYMSAGTTVKIF